MLASTLCSAVLAIRSINKHVFIGIGNSLHVYEIESKELVAKLKVLEHDNIHSIVKGPANKLFVYGGKSLGVCDLDITNDEVKLDLCFIRQFNDWIIAIGWTQNEGSTQLSILFAHNNIRFYDINTKNSRTAWCQEKCILYGGSILAKNNREIVIFSGTVFQEILIWQANVDQDYVNEIAVLHRLKGHNGVIFSVVYDPSLRIISSTSDDRTIRLWRVANSRSDEKEIGWENCEIEETATIYAHTARVWRTMIRNDKILSIGEDSVMCIFSIAGKLLGKVMSAHHGAEIRSIDVSDDNKFVFTGGADGAVNIWPFEFTDHPQGSLIFASNEQKVPKYVSYKNDGSIFIFLDGGHLISYDSVFRKTRACLDLPRFSSYCVMQSSPDARKICLGSKDGYIEIYEEILHSGTWTLQNTLKKKVMESIIFSFHWLNIETILVCGEAGLLKLITNLSKDDHCVSTFILPKSRGRWTTAATIYKNLLICGDRDGSVYVFDLDHGDNEAGPSQIFSKIHGRQNVKSLSIFGNKILSTGLDGTLRFYELNEDETKRSLRLLHFDKMPMDWLCKTLPTNDDLYVLGFRETEFMIYSMNLKRLVGRFDCGGGHRSWDCTIVDGKMNFLYIRNKRVYEIDCLLRNANRPILNGFHTREIYCLRPIVTSSMHNIFISAGEDCTLRVSCIIATNSKIQKHLVNTLCIYEGHISNVKSLAVLNLQNSEKITRNLVVSGGGRAQLKIWEICVKVGRFRMSREEVTCKELLSYMLRGTDKDRKKKWQSITPGFFVDPETRFMDMSAQFYLKDQNFVVIFVACSDGYLRIFLYDIANNCLTLSNVMNHCNRCTLKVNSFVHENETILMTMTTDGFISFWETSKSVENLVRSAREKIESEATINHPFAKMRIHQSGINSFDFRKFDDSRWLLLTGGDDNLLSLVLIDISSIEDQFSVNMLASWNSSSIHSAQITGAKFVDNNRMLSTGIDQRVVAHSYVYEHGLLSVSQIEEIPTFVPDVQGLALCRTCDGNDVTFACVYGQGLETIMLKSENRWA